LPWTTDFRTAVTVDLKDFIAVCPYDEVTSVVSQPPVLLSKFRAPKAPILPRFDQFADNIPLPSPGKCCWEVRYFGGFYLYWLAIECRDFHANLKVATYPKRSPALPVLPSSRDRLELKDATPGDRADSSQVCCPARLNGSARLEYTM
jgi:hypothetical protein